MEPEKITFPCDYPIKVVARAGDGLRERLDAVFTRHLGAFEPQRVSARESARANFVAWTYVMLVHRAEQLGPLHVELQAVEGVVMVI